MGRHVARVRHLVALSRANKRDMAANMQWWLHDDDQDGKALAAREAARQDRANSRSNRTSSAVDRGLLAEDNDPRDGDATDVPDR